MKHYDEICVSLDIETTGLAKERDRIIEIGAVKFQGEEILDSFETLVNPEMAVPYEVLSITGIKESELLKAPSFEEIKEKLKKFIVNYPIVGHNIDFDLGFLENNGLSIKNLRYDTWHLALILLPNLPLYSLESLARVLEIEQLDQHRALVDAQTAKDLFLYLINLIFKIKKTVRQEINSYIEKSELDLGWLFKKVKINEGAREIASNKQVGPKKESKVKRKPIPIKFKDLENILKPKGEIADLSKSLKLGLNEESLIQACADSFLNKKFSFFESRAQLAGYLIPAIYYSSSAHKKIIIASTYNKKVRLIKEFSLLKNFIPFDFNFFEFKDSYFCLRKFNNFKKQIKFSTVELKTLIKVLLWLDSEPDVNTEINFSAEERKLWPRFSYSPSDCSSRECPCYNDCLFYQACRKARKAQIILVEQTTFFKDIFLLSSEKFLPAFRDFMITEVQQIEDSATLAATMSFSRGNQETLWHNIADSFANLKSNLNNKNSIDVLEDSQNDLVVLEKKFEIFWGLWGMFWQEKTKERNSVYLSLGEHTRFGPSWNKIKDDASSLSLSLGRLVGVLESLVQKMKKDLLNDSKLIIELNNFAQQIKKQITFIEGFIVQKYLDKKFIYWASFKNEGEDISLFKTPLDMKELIFKNLFISKDSGILISPAISEKEYNYMKERLGLDKFKMIKLPKNSKDQKLSINIIENLPEPAKPGYKKQLIVWLIKFVKESKGNTFVLFNSQETIKETYKALLPIFDDRKINVFSQDRTSVKKILENLGHQEKNERFFILGKDNLLSYLESSGLLLNNLVIAKLPFESLAYPIKSARAEHLLNGFKNYTLPRSIIRLKENLSEFSNIAFADSEIYLLDGRLISRDYGLDFLKSLTDFNLIYKK